MASDSEISFPELDRSPRSRTLFNSDWLFLKSDAPVDETIRVPSEATVDYDASAWRGLNLPHDWGIEGPFKQEYKGDAGKLAWWGVGWYRKQFSVPPSLLGKRVFIDFDGAMSHSQVWLNGELIGGWPYGYTSFRLELTPHLNVGGENVIAVRLNNPIESSRWYAGGGIYRNVWLTATSTLHVGHWGTFVSTPEVSTERALVLAEVCIENTDTHSQAMTAEMEIYSIDKGKAGSLLATSFADVVEVSAASEQRVRLNIELLKPRLWCLDAPHLYLSVIKLKVGATTVDRYETIFGVRHIEFSADNGFCLNGQRVQLNGVCNHQDLGALGVAVHERGFERQIELLQEMGCNAIRTSHNPPAPELLNLCDRMGMLVIDEAFDCWEMGKKPNDYSTLFKEWHQKDLRALIRRDRNHPCVILWSTGNEVLEQLESEMYPISNTLTRIVHEEDPTRAATIGCHFLESGHNGFAKTFDIFGYNYKPHAYSKFHEDNPEIPLYGSETASCVSTRGEYAFPVEDDKSKGMIGFQVSSYDLYAPRWATPPDNEFQGLDTNPEVAGEFVWTGFDYLGEPTPFNLDTTNLLNLVDPKEQVVIQKQMDELGGIPVPSRSSYFGILDLAGFKKDRFYIYQARWRPEFPMAHILPHWNWPERIGLVTPVHVYTSGDEAELFLNGESLGRQTREPLQYRFRWEQVVYQPGELRVETWKHGKPWASQTMQTTGEAAKISITPDRVEIQADGCDLSYLTAAVTDREGRIVPRSHNLLKFEINGPAEIVAVDNGDPTSHVSFRSHQMKAFNGLCLVVVRSRVGMRGDVSVQVKSDGLESSTTRLVVN